MIPGLKLLWQVFIEGTPTAKGRPRFSRKSGRTFTPKATTEAEANVRDRAQMFEIPCHETREPLMLQLVIFKARPKSNKDPMPLGKPDTDNFVKLILDALNGIAYPDDAIVVQVQATKVYSPTGQEGIGVRLYRMTSVPDIHPEDFFPC